MGEEGPREVQTAGRVRELGEGRIQVVHCGAQACVTQLWVWWRSVQLTETLPDLLPHRCRAWQGWSGRAKRRKMGRRKKKSP